MSRDQLKRGTHPIRLVSVGVLAAIGLLVSACSSSGSAPAAGTTAAGPASVVASSPAASAATPTPSPAGSADSGGGGANLGSGSFCTVAKAEQKQSEKESTAYSSGDPASLKKLETDGLSELQRFVSIAPSAIKPDVQLIATADQKLFNALKAARFMIAKVDQSVLTQLQTPAFTAAEKHITTYLATTCGIRVDASGSN